MTIEDIVEFGWNYEKTQPGMDESFFSKDTDQDQYDWLGLDYDTESNWCRIYYSKCNGDTTRFSGWIKTKDEFKILMNQLRIK